MIADLLRRGYRIWILQIYSIGLEATFYQLVVLKGFAAFRQNARLANVDEKAKHFVRRVQEVQGVQLLNLLLNVREILGSDHPSIVAKNCIHESFAKLFLVFYRNRLGDPLTLVTQD